MTQPIVRTIYPKSVTFVALASGIPLPATLVTWDKSAGGPVLAQIRYQADKIQEGLADEPTFSFLAFPMKVNYVTVRIKDISFADATTGTPLLAIGQGGTMTLNCECPTGVSPTQPASANVPVLCGDSFIESWEVVQGFGGTDELAINFVCKGA
jgi:hypothetical protein